MQTGSIIGNVDNIKNLKLVINVAANKLDIFSRSGGAVPDANNQMIWNPKSDYGYSKTLATTVTQESDIAVYSVVSLVVKQSGKYLILGHVTGNGEITSLIQAFIKTGSATYASAVQKSYGYERGGAEFTMSAPVDCAVYLNAGDTIHLGGGVESTSATRSLFGDSSSIGLTGFTFIRID